MGSILGVGLVIIFSVIGFMVAFPIYEQDHPVAFAVYGIAMCLCGMIIATTIFAMAGYSNGSTNI